MPFESKLVKVSKDKEVIDVKWIFHDKLDKEDNVVRNKPSVLTLNQTLVKMGFQNDQIHKT